MSLDEAEGLLHAMAREFGGDPAATDTTRVLRLPGFANKKYETDFYVESRRESTATYNLRDFRLHIDPHDSPSRNYSTNAKRESSPRAYLSQSEHDWAFAKRALARGEEPEEVIRQIAEHRAKDKSNPEYYARYTVEKARNGTRNGWFRLRPGNDTAYGRTESRTLTIAAWTCLHCNTAKVLIKSNPESSEAPLLRHEMPVAPVSVLDNIGSPPVQSRKRGKCMSRRTGQNPKVRVKKRSGGQKCFFFQYWIDVPGQEERKRKTQIIGPTNQMTKSEAERKKVDFLLNLELNSTEYQIPSSSSFANAVSHYRDVFAPRMLRPSTFSTADGHLRTHLEQIGTTSQ